MASKSTRGRPHGINKGQKPKTLRSGAIKSGPTTAALSATRTTSLRLRETKTHIFFWGGILSNWHTQSPPFLGLRCLGVMLPRLDDLGISHPDPDCVSTKLLAAHAFNCGEQWMMAVKAWLFERSTTLGQQLVDLHIDDSVQDKIGKNEFEQIQHAVMRNNPQGETERYSDLCSDTLSAVLRASKPGAQKALGRRVHDFDDEVWSRACITIVVASCIARAEMDLALRSLYLKSATKNFVEGSPTDGIWGVGLAWNDPLIDDVANWRGENRLGKCHDEAAAYIRAADNQQKHRVASGI